MAVVVPSKIITVALGLGASVLALLEDHCAVADVVLALVGEVRVVFVLFWLAATSASRDAPLRATTTRATVYGNGVKIVSLRKNRTPQK